MLQISGRQRSHQWSNMVPERPASEVQRELQLQGRPSLSQKGRKWSRHMRICVGQSLSGDLGSFWVWRRDWLIRRATRCRVFKQIASRGRVRAEDGFETLSSAAKNATDLLTVREAMEARDEQEARRLSAM